MSSNNSPVSSNKPRDQSTVRDETILPHSKPAAHDSKRSPLQSVSKMSPKSPTAPVNRPRKTISDEEIEGELSAGVRDKAPMNAKRRVDDDDMPTLELDDAQEIPKPRPQTSLPKTPVKRPRDVTSDEDAENKPSSGMRGKAPMKAKRRADDDDALASGTDDDQEDPEPLPQKRLKDGNRFATTSDHVASSSLSKASVKQACERMSDAKVAEKLSQLKASSAVLRRKVSENASSDEDGGEGSESDAHDEDVDDNRGAGSLQGTTGAADEHAASKHQEAKKAAQSSKKRKTPVQRKKPFWIKFTVSNDDELNGIYRLVASFLTTLKTHKVERSPRPKA
eukprot:ANDGO_07221.mRNA.1 hypothetical protein